ncbi:Brix-domain-containing protein [Xylaria bambusicola]|uniref:Brix-domain-containing protein n=1 Tax=Xylaria bambusicola TaxID=326684 RepID=UPI002008760E|nr:Brix-domain-containing protein [Xylaria bambusicola]KAI0512676.1 Brix-domain-containing protein [Xylaria bambusicola]
MASHRNRTVAQKTSRAKEKRERRFARKKDEKRDPSLRAARLAKNKPITLDQKRVWDDVDDEELTSSVDLQALRRRRLQQAEDAERQAIEAAEAANDDDDNDADSMLDSDSDSDHEMEQDHNDNKRESSLAPSVASTSNIDLTPELLLAKFPMLFSPDARPSEPKILITTDFNSTIHHIAAAFESIIPNAKYVRRSAHHYGHKYSVREITKFAENRGFSSLLVLREDNKRPSALDLIDIPSKVSFHFSISSWVDGKKLPGHGVSQGFHPELLLNNFNTPLGLCTAKVLQSLFPASPELAGREVCTFHNQRDYIFFRRHRYIFRERRETEKSVVAADGKNMAGVENIRSGLQELGPRFTLKLRRISKGIGFAGSDPNDPTHWQWKAKMEKDRKRFNL